MTDGKQNRSVGWGRDSRNTRKSWENLPLHPADILDENLGRYHQGRRQRDEKPLVPCIGFDLTNGAPQT